MTEFDSGRRPASIASVTDRVRPLAIGAPVASVYFLGEQSPPSSAPRRSVALANDDGRSLNRIEVHGGGILCAASDGKRIVIGGDDGKLVALDAKGETQILATDAKRRWIDNVALHADGAIAWSAGKTAFVQQRQGRGAIASTCPRPSAGWRLRRRAFGLRSRITTA